MDTSPRKQAGTAQAERGASDVSRTGAGGPGDDPGIGSKLAIAGQVLLTAIPVLWAVALVSGFWHHVHAGVGVWTAAALLMSVCAGAATYRVLGGGA